MIKNDSLSKSDGWSIFSDYEGKVGAKEFAQIQIGLPSKVIDPKTGKETNDFINREIQEVNIPINAPWSKTVIGITFRSGYIVTDQDVGKDLQLVPNYDNPYDPDAIQIHFNNQQLGFCCQGATGQWTATKVKKLWELGYETKARILAVCGGIPEFENCETVEELLKVFIDNYVLNFETTFKVKLDYSKMNTKPPAMKSSEVRADCLKKGLSKIESDKELAKIKQQWQDYTQACDNQQLIIDKSNDEMIDYVIKNKPELVEKLQTLLKTNNYRQLKTFTGIDIKNKGVKYCLLITPTDKVKKVKKEVDYKKTKATNSQMGFYMD